MTRSRLDGARKSSPLPAYPVRGVIYRNTLPHSPKMQTVFESRGDRPWCTVTACQGPGRHGAGHGSAGTSYWLPSRKICPPAAVEWQVVSGMKTSILKSLSRLEKWAVPTVAKYPGRDRNMCSRVFMQASELPMVLIVTVTPYCRCWSGNADEARLTQLPSAPYHLVNHKRYSVIGGPG